MAEVSHFPTALPDPEVDITIDMVATMLEGQFPEYANQPLRLGSSGWDNVLVRIGDSLAARLPRRELAARHAAVELDWLPAIGRAWHFSAPIPLAIGQPDANAGYPWRWSVVPWLAGHVALDAPLSVAGAADLGEALAQVHAPAPVDAPLNPVRSLPLPKRRDRFEHRLAMLEQDPTWRVDATAAMAIFDAADARDRLWWCHMDIHGNNILTREGRLAGVLDWGDCGAGDPATDLGQAWCLIGADLFAVLADSYLSARGPADPSAPRVKAEAVLYAATLATLQENHYSASGWRALEALGVAHTT